MERLGNRRFRAADEAGACDAASSRCDARRTRQAPAGLEALVDLRPDVVVNAAGIAAAALVGDDTVYPVRGQIVRVVNAGLTLSVRDEHHHDGRAYVHPRSHDCILGGAPSSTGAGTPSPTLRRPRPSCAAAPTSCPSSPARRPSRASRACGLVGAVRLEVDRALLPVPVVRNYGHGGAGITLGWGCADEVTATIQRLGLCEVRVETSGSP